jgi:site-specific DNA-cytosine methylase
VNVAAPPTLNLLSICTGGGGLDLAVELAIPRARVVCMVEREAFAVARLVEAMRKVSWLRRLSGQMPEPSEADRGAACVDGVFGGIPCQPHSLAGKRLGRRRRARPLGAARRIFVHPARGSSSSRTSAACSRAAAPSAFTETYADWVSVEGGLFTASEVGAPHERERLFILGVHDPPSLFPPGPDDADGWAAILAQAPHLEPAVRRMADGMAPRVDQLRMLGNGVQPLQGAYAFRAVATELADRSPGAAFLVRLMGES